MKKLLRRTVKLVKITATDITYGNTIDAYGMQEKTKETYSIKAEIQPVTDADLVILVPGQLTIGDAVGWFLDSYDVKGKTITVDPDDLVLDKDYTYRVDTIQDPTDGNTIIYRRAYLRRMSGGGS